MYRKSVRKAVTAQGDSFILTGVLDEEWSFDLLGIHYPQFLQSENIKCSTCSRHLLNCVIINVCVCEFLFVPVYFFVSEHLSILFKDCTCMIFKTREKEGGRERKERERERRERENLLTCFYSLFCFSFGSNRYYYSHSSIPPIQHRQDPHFHTGMQVLCVNKRNRVY